MKRRICTLVLCLLACATAGIAQTTFEAADIHASAGTSGIRLPFINSEMRGGYNRAGRYELHNATLTDLIATAWGVETDKVTGGPAWMDTDQFEVVAKAPVDASPEQIRLMLQALLEERFKLTVHKDQKPFPQYALTAGKHPLLKESAGGESGCQSPPQNAQNSASDPIAVMNMVCHNTTMAQLASRLPRNYSQATPVVDLTGLKGSWDFSLKWTQRSQLAAAGAEGISIFDAVEKQLGLKLEVQMVPMPVIVVDGANRRPTDNLPGVSKSLPPIPVQFEVADIKPSAPGSDQKSFRLMPGGRLDLRGFTLKDLIKLAWEIADLDVIDNDDMLVGATKGLDATRFDIVAAVSSAGPQYRLDTDSARLLLRALLADRFQLTTHTEDRPVSAYAMVAVKPKLRRADPSSRPGCRNAPARSGYVPIFQLHCQSTTMAQLAEKLPAFGGLYVNHPVFDATGLEGAWDFDLSWSPPHLIRGGGETGAGAADPNGGLTIVEALDRQLGLKLVPQKHPMPVLVIDRVELKPTDN